MNEITILGTFLEGLLSFLSPCVLPLVPLYMAYLSGDNKEVDGQGNIKYNQKKVFLRTLFFVLGIFVVFSLLAISINSIKQYVEDYKDIISIVGSVIILIFGLHEIGVIQVNVFNNQTSLVEKLHLNKMTFIKAFLFGVFFAFAWTPCIGPMLSSALLLAVSQEGGILYLISYALGLTIPFIITGIATSYVLNLLNRFKKVLNYVLKIAGVILICFAIFMFKNASKNIVEMRHTVETQEERNNSPYLYLPDITFYDQNNNEIRFKDYEGKYVLINYITTWCTYCKQEIPEYIEFAKNNEDVVCLYAMSIDANREGIEAIYDYAKDNNIELPIVIDANNKIISLFNISSYPTTCFIGPDSSLIGYASGMLTEDLFETYYNQCIEMYESR